MRANPWLARARKALHMPPRYVLGRLRDELREAARRPWSRVYPRTLRDATILGASGARSLSELWDHQSRAPFFLSSPDRDRHTSAFRTRYPESMTAVMSAADAALRHEFEIGRAHV